MSLATSCSLFLFRSVPLLKDTLLSTPEEVQQHKRHCQEIKDSIVLVTQQLPVHRGEERKWRNILSLQQFQCYFIAPQSVPGIFQMWNTQSSLSTVSHMVLTEHHCSTYFGRSENNSLWLKTRESACPSCVTAAGPQPGAQPACLPTVILKAKKGFWNHRSSVPRLEGSSCFLGCSL